MSMFDMFNQPVPDGQLGNPRNPVRDALNPWSLASALPGGLGGAGLFWQYILGRMPGASFARQGTSARVPLDAREYNSSEYNGASNATEQDGKTSQGDLNMAKMTNYGSSSLPDPQPMQDQRLERAAQMGYSDPPQASSSSSSAAGGSSSVPSDQSRSTYERRTNQYGDDEYLSDWASRIYGASSAGKDYDTNSTRNGYADSPYAQWMASRYGASVPGALEIQELLNPGTADKDTKTRATQAGMEAFANGGRDMTSSSAMRAQLLQLADALEQAKTSPDGVANASALRGMTAKDQLALLSAVLPGIMGEGSGYALRQAQDLLAAQDQDVTGAGNSAQNGPYLNQVLKQIGLR